MWRPFLIFNQKMSEKNNNEELRPTKMRGVAFPKAKYGVILAVIIIIVGQLCQHEQPSIPTFSQKLYNVH